MTRAAEPLEKRATVDNRSSAGLLAVLGVVFGLSVTVGNTIGSGILRTPGVVAQLLPTPFLFIAIWIVGAGYAALGANALAELHDRNERIAVIAVKSLGRARYAHLD